MLTQALIVSRDQSPHVDRFERVLSKFLFNVEIVDPVSVVERARDASLVVILGLDLASELAMTVPRGARIIAVSNAIDLMRNSSVQTAGRAVLALSDQIWVDTLWAEGVLAELGAKNVRNIPWGLELSTMPKSSKPANTSNNIMFPRVNSDHYQPKVVSNVARRLLNDFPVGRVKIISELGTNGALGLVEGELRDKRLSITPPVMEAELIQLLENFSIVVMTPLTDGTSVTMLQALHRGKIVVSTPTVGALEWLSDLPNGFVSHDFSVDAVVEEIRKAILCKNFDGEIGKQKVVAKANLEENIRSALLALELTAQ